MDCLFCRILKNELPASFVYRDEKVAAFLDINPINKGHVLVIPTRHAKDLEDLFPDDGAHMFLVARKVAAALKVSGLPCEGINLFFANGKAAGQEVFHMHLHVIPRVSGDGFGLKFPTGSGANMPRSDLDGIAKEIGLKLQV